MLHNLKKTHICYCSPGHMLFKNSQKMHMLVMGLQYAWTHVIARHDIQFLSVQWDHTSSMVVYEDHVSTASSQRDCVSQSTLNHGNLANWCGRRS